MSIRPGDLDGLTFSIQWKMKYSDGIRGISFPTYFPGDKGGEKTITPQKNLALTAGIKENIIRVTSQLYGKDISIWLNKQDIADCLFLSGHGRRTTGEFLAEGKNPWSLNPLHPPLYWLNGEDQKLKLVIFGACSAMAINTLKIVGDYPWNQRYIGNEYYFSANLDAAPPPTPEQYDSSPGIAWDKAYNWTRGQYSNDPQVYDENNFRITFCGFYWRSRGISCPMAEELFTAWENGKDQVSGAVGSTIPYGDDERIFPKLWCAASRTVYFESKKTQPACAIGRKGYYYLTRQKGAKGLADIPIIVGPYTRDNWGYAFGKNSPIDGEENYFTGDVYERGDEE